MRREKALEGRNGNRAGDTTHQAQETAQLLQSPHTAQEGHGHGEDA